MWYVRHVQHVVCGIWIHDKARFPQGLQPLCPFLTNVATLSSFVQGHSVQESDTWRGLWECKRNSEYYPMLLSHQLPSHVSQVQASLSCRAEGLPWLWVLHGATEKSSWARRKTVSPR